MKLHLFDGQTTHEADLLGMNLSPISPSAGNWATKTCSSNPKAPHGQASRAMARAISK